MEQQYKNKGQLLVKEKRQIYTGFIQLGIAVIILLVTRNVPRTANWYAEHIYPVLVSTIGRMIGIIPFSAAEILLYVFIGTFAYHCYQIAKGTRKRLWSKKETVLKLAGKLSVTIGSLFLCYILGCGVNYYRDSFAEMYDMKPDGYSEAHLIEVAEDLTGKINACGEAVKRDDNGLAVYEGNEQKEAVNTMHQIGGQYPALEGYYPRPKSLLVPQILSYQSLTGIYVPFTIEANYNGAIVDYNIPFTACHELSHLRGFMREDEANFIAYLACTNSDEDMFRYSGYLVGWIHTMNALYKINPEKHSEIYGEVSPEVYVDLKANSEFWNTYKGKISEVADKVNDTYLKANKQADGVASYGKMVDLILYDYYN